MKTPLVADGNALVPSKTIFDPDKVVLLVASAFRTPLWCWLSGRGFNSTEVFSGVDVVGWWNGHIHSDVRLRALRPAVPMAFPLL